MLLDTVVVDVDNATDVVCCCVCSPDCLPKELLETEVVTLLVLTTVPLLVLTLPTLLALTGVGFTTAF